MDPTGVLVLRIWREPGEAEALRVRITTKLDVDLSAETSETFDAADSVDAVCDSVRRFLLTFSART